MSKDVLYGYRSLRIFLIDPGQNRYYGKGCKPCKEEIIPDPEAVGADDLTEDILDLLLGFVAGRYVVTCAAGIQRKCLKFLNRYLTVRCQRESFKAHKI